MKAAHVRNNAATEMQHQTSKSECTRHVGQLLIQQSNKQKGKMSFQKPLMDQTIKAY